MRNMTFRRWMRLGLLAGILGSIMPATPIAEAHGGRGHHRYENRREHRWDRRWDRHLYRQWRRDVRFRGSYRIGRIPPWGLWAMDVPRIRYGDRPFYFHAGLGVYFGGFALELELGNRAPRGYVFVHPPTGKRFYTVRQFRRWHSRHPYREPILVLLPRY